MPFILSFAVGDNRCAHTITYVCPWEQAKISLNFNERRKFTKIPIRRNIIAHVSTRLKYIYIFNHAQACMHVCAYKAHSGLKLLIAPAQRGIFIRKASSKCILCCCSNCEFVLFNINAIALYLLVVDMKFHVITKNHIITLNDTR